MASPTRETNQEPSANKKGAEQSDRQVVEPSTAALGSLGEISLATSLIAASREELKQNNPSPLRVSLTPSRLSLTEIMSSPVAPQLFGNPLPSALSKDTSLSSVQQKLKEALEQTQKNEATLRSGITTTDTIASAARFSEHQQRLTETLAAIAEQGTRAFLPDIVSSLLSNPSEELVAKYSALYDRAHEVSIPGLADALPSASLLDISAAIERIASLEGGHLDKHQKSLILTALVTGNEQEIFRLEESLVTELLVESFERHKPLQAEKDTALKQLEALEKRADELKNNPRSGHSEPAPRLDQKAIRDQIVPAAKHSADVEYRYQGETDVLRKLQTELILSRAERFKLEHREKVDTALLESLNTLPRESWNHSPRLLTLWASSLEKLEAGASSEFSAVEELRLSKGRDAALDLAINNYKSEAAVGDLYRQAEAGVVLEEYSAEQDARIRSAAGDAYSSSMLPADPRVRSKQFLDSSYASLTSSLSKLLYVETAEGKGRFVVADKAVRDRIAAAPPGYKAVLARLPEAVGFRSLTLGEMKEVNDDFLSGPNRQGFVADSSVLAPDFSSVEQVARATLKPEDVVYVALASSEPGARELKLDNGVGQKTYREEDLAREAVAGEELSALVQSLRETKEALGKGVYLYQRYVALAQKLENGMATNTKKPEWVEGVRVAASEVEKLQKSAELYLVQKKLKDLSERLAAVSTGRTSSNEHDPALEYITKLSSELSRLVETKEIEKVTEFIAARDFDPDTWGKWGRTQGVRIGTTLAGATALASIPATMGTSSPLAVAILSGFGAYAGGEIGLAALSHEYKSYKSKLQRFGRAEIGFRDYVLESGLEIAYGAATTYVLGAVGREIGNSSRQVIAQSSSFGAKELAALTVVKGAKAFEQMERVLEKVIPGSSNYTSIWAREFVDEVIEEGLQGGLGATGAAIEDQNFFLGQALKAASSTVSILSSARGRSNVSLETGGVTLEVLPEAKRFIESGILETRFSYEQDSVEGLITSLRAQGLKPELDTDTGEVRVYRGSTEFAELGINVRQEEVYLPSKAPAFMRELAISSRRADGSSMLSDCGFKISTDGALSVESLHTEQGVSLLSYLRRQGITVAQTNEGISLRKGKESTQLTLASEIVRTTNTVTRSNADSSPTTSERPLLASAGPAGGTPDRVRTDKELTEMLKRGELPNEVLKRVSALPPADPIAIEFQAEMRKLFALMYPNSTEQPRFLLSLRPGINAGYLVSANPPTMLFNVECFNGSTRLPTPQLMGILAHEWGHHRIRQEYGPEANSKIEEGLADIYALQDLENLGIDPLHYFKLIRDIASDETHIIDVLDPHPTRDTRLAVAEAWFTNSYTNASANPKPIDQQRLAELSFEFLAPVTPVVAGMVEPQDSPIQGIIDRYRPRDEADDWSGRETDYEEEDADYEEEDIDYTITDPAQVIDFLDAIVTSPAVGRTEIEQLANVAVFDLSESSLASIEQFCGRIDLSTLDAKTLEMFDELLIRVFEQSGHELFAEARADFIANGSIDSAKRLVELTEQYPVFARFLSIDVAELHQAHGLPNLIRLAGTEQGQAVALCLVRAGIIDARLLRHPSCHDAYTMEHRDFGSSAYGEAEEERGFSIFHETMAKLYETDRDFMIQDIKEREAAILAFAPDQLGMEREAIAEDVRRAKSGLVLFPELLMTNAREFLDYNLNTVTIYDSDIDQEELQGGLVELFEEKLDSADGRSAVACALKSLPLYEGIFEEVLVGTDVTLFDDSIVMNFILTNVVQLSETGLFTTENALELVANSGILTRADGYYSSFLEADCTEALETLYPLLGVSRSETPDFQERIAKLMSQPLETSEARAVAKLAFEFELRRELALGNLDADAIHQALRVSLCSAATFERLERFAPVDLRQIVDKTRNYSAAETQRLLEYSSLDAVSPLLNISSQINLSGHVAVSYGTKVAEKLLSNISKLIEADPNCSERERNAGEMLKRGATKIRLLETQQRLLRTLNSAVAESLGPDDGSTAYRDHTVARLEAVLAPLPRSLHKPLVDSVLREVKSQELLTHASASLVKNQLSGDFFTRTYEEQATFDLTKVLLDRDETLRMRMLNYLVNEPDAPAEGLLVESLESRTDITPHRNSNQGQRRRDITEEVRILRESFWDAPMESRILLITQLLVPTDGYQVSPDRWHAAKTFAYNQLKLHGKLNSPEAEEFLDKYLDSFPSGIPGVRRNALGAVLAAAEVQTNRTTTAAGSEIDGLCTIMELMGPAEVKAGQAASGHPLTSDEFKQRLGRLKNRAAEPTRIELFEWISASVPAEVRQEIAHYGEIVGSGSLFVTIEVETAQGKGVLQVLRPGALVRAERGFERIEKAIDTSRLSANNKSYLLELVRQGKLDIHAETDVGLSRQQADIFKDLYQGAEVRVRTSTGVETYRFETPDLLGFGEKYRLMRYVPGEHFVDMPAGPRKTELAKAILAVELSNIFSGGHFDKDSHGGNVKIEGQTIYRFDSGAVTLVTPSQADLQVLADLIQRSMARAQSDGSNNPLAAFFEEARSLRETQGAEFPAVVGETQRALLALSEYHNELSPQELMDVVKAAYEHAHPAVGKVLRSQAISQATEEAGGVNLRLVGRMFRAALETPPIQVQRPAGDR